MTPDEGSLPDASPTMSTRALHVVLAWGFSIDSTITKRRREAARELYGRRAQFLSKKELAEVAAAIAWLRKLPETRRLAGDR